MADVYLDACCFIYLVEGQPEWRTVVEQRIRGLEPISKLITSQLARLECRTKPMREANRSLLERYDMLFGADRVAVLDVSEQVVDRATELRARYSETEPAAPSPENSAGKLRSLLDVLSPTTRVVSTPMIGGSLSSVVYLQNWARCEGEGVQVQKHAT